MKCARFSSLLCLACNRPFCSPCAKLSTHSCPTPTQRLLPPIADQKTHWVTFGPVEGENRGENLLSQPRYRLDPWFWLRDDDRKAAHVIDHLKVENAYAAQQTAHLDSFKESLYKEHLSHLKETDDDPAYSLGPYFYYTRTVEGLSYKIHCRKKKQESSGWLPTDDLPEMIVLDENVIAKGHTECSVVGVRVSPDHRLAAYHVDFNGSEDYEVKIKTLNETGTGDHLPDSLLRVEGGSAEWGEDNKSIYYVTRDETKRPYKLWYHALGAPQSDDICLLTENDEKFCLDVFKSNSGRFLFAHATSSETSEVRYLDLLAPFTKDTQLTMIQPRQFGLRYEVEHLGANKLVILTNLEEKINQRLMVANLSNPGMQHWTDLIPYDDSRMLEHVTVFAKYIALEGRQGGLSRLWLVDVSETFEVSNLRRLEFPEELYEVATSVNKEYNSPYLRLFYSSLVTPPTWFNYVMDRNNAAPLQLVKTTEILQYDPKRYECSRLFATAPDGTSIPMSVVRLKSDEKAAESKRSPVPCMLYGYGSYGLCMDPGFDRWIIPYLDRGVTYVIAHIRGGGEMGRYWYEKQGKYLTKRNTFSDFIACAEHLVKEGITEPNLLAIEGRSAGGLLVGAVANMRPDLFRVVLAGVPFVDVLNTMCDSSIPLTTGEWEEWGNPNDPKFFDYMLSYSPMDQVRSQPYPTMMITAGLHDPRVAYWEPAKWASKLRFHKSEHCATSQEKAKARGGKIDIGEVLLKVDLDTGHFSASDRYKKMREKSFEMAVVLDCLGLAGPVKT